MGRIVEWINLSPRYLLLLFFLADIVLLAPHKYLSVYPLLDLAGT